MTENFFFFFFLWIYIEEQLHEASWHSNKTKQFSWLCFPVPAQWDQCTVKESQSVVVNVNCQTEQRKVTNLSSFFFPPVWQTSASTRNVKSSVKCKNQYRSTLSWEFNSKGMNVTTEGIVNAAAGGRQNEVPAALIHTCTAATLCPCGKVSV